MRWEGVGARKQRERKKEEKKASRSAILERLDLTPDKRRI